MSKRLRVAYLHVGLNPNGYNRGPVRFSIVFFQECMRRQAAIPFKMLLFTTAEKEKITAEKKYQKGIVKLNQINNRFKAKIEAAEFLFRVLVHRIQLVHIAHYSASTECDHRLKVLELLPGFLRPKVTLTHLYAPLPQAMKDKSHYYHEHALSKYGPVFSDLNIDGYFSYYDNLEPFLKQENYLKKNQKVYCIEHYFCDTENYYSGNKENIILWAHAMDRDKMPFFFLDAVKWLLLNSKELQNWKVIMCGKGDIQEEVKKEIINKGLLDIIELRTDVTDLSTIANHSKCFVSTMPLENFTSLSMNESMAAGNAIIARNVGRTYLYVKDGENGFLTDDDAPEGIAKCLKKFIESPDIQEKFMKNSVKQVKEVHNSDNFIKEIATFWHSLIQ